MNKIQKLVKNLLKEEYDIQHRLLNLALFFGMCGVFVSLITSIFLGFGLWSNLLVFILLIFFGICFWIANGLNHPQISAVIICLVLNDFIFPALYITSGGINSGMPAWMVLGLMSSIVLMKGKKTIPVFFISLAGFVGAVIFGHFRPDLFYVVESKISILIDMIFAVGIISAILGSLFKYQSYVNDKQKMEILKSYREAKKAADAKSEFLSNMSHDIRTPINAVIGYTEMAKKNLDDKAKLSDCISKISIASEHLSTLLTEVLEMNKIEQGSNYTYEEEVCKVSDIVNDVLTILENDINQKNINVHVDFSMMEDDVVSCDRIHIHQILQNVIGNAIKYSAADKTILIQVIRFDDADETKINCEFHIKDEGCGISSDFMDKVFVPFEREKNIINRSVQGTGLGLSITKSLVDVMKGTIEVNSELDKGSEFIITLPLMIPALDELAPNDDSFTYNFHGKRILIVDDDEMSREIAAEILRDAGAEVEEVVDGSFAVEKVSLSEPGYYNLILMDIVMPVVDGLEATKIIRNLENKELSEIPIIALSANPFKEDKRKAFYAGMDAYLVKPMRITELVKAIGLILQEEKVLI